MEETNKKKVILRNKSYKTYEDIKKDLDNLMLKDELKFVEYFDLNRNYVNENHISQILLSNYFDFAKIKVMNL